MLNQDCSEPASLSFRQVFTWVDTVPGKEKLNSIWMAQTWRYFGEALDALRDEQGVTDSKIQEEKFNAKAS